MSLLVKARRDGSTLVDITPESAGWGHVGFRAVRLTQGQADHFETGRTEVCLTVLTGRVNVQVGGERFEGLGGRSSVFDESSPHALYITTHQAVSVTALGDAEVAYSSAPAQGLYPTRLIDPSTMKRSVRGQGANTRYVCDILPETEPAEGLLVVEVVTPAGHSSSYPPHKHDTAGEGETVLEETYYHRLDPAQGFAFQRVYTDDRSLDEAMAVEDHDTVMVPRGYHPTVAPFGYRLYYLNTMAGPQRKWAFKNDPAHEWMLR
ncbi:5-deoxy-glucuronate isomerase [Aquabacterium sp.]|uniref:5-deoxy-glucuronate isomerase n=1 Tax=Aquabacterium sp. TaxID=1872578 RepID=UPI0025C63EAF|nr:5-deoxy-glucuronate isomerase [Aquabacterium sp.]